MKKVILISLIMTVLFGTAFSDKLDEMLVFSYEKPYKYEMVNGNYKVKALIKKENWTEGVEVSFNGEVLAIEKLTSGDVEILLPLVGDPGLLKVSKDGKTVSTQKFEPLIPVDWGYFAEGNVHVISTSHQDIAWTNPIEIARTGRVHDIIIPALDIIEEEPGFKFEMEQTLNLMEAIDYSPENTQRLIDTYKSENFEWGATLTQPYEGLESGEQLVRQSYFGRRWIKKTFPEMDAKVAYNVDVPGRSLQVPQIFKKSGIDYLFVSRMKEGFYNWYSPDGTKILTYSPGNYGWTLLVDKYLEEDAVTALHKVSKVLKNWNEYYQKRNLPPNYALVISTDAGGPKHYKEVLKSWNEIVKNTGLKIPKIAHSTSYEFLHSIDVPGIKIDSIYGERPNLWLYIHGAAHYEAIKAKREAAVNLPAAEIFNTINCQLNKGFSTYPKKEFDEAWYKSIYPDHGWGGEEGHVTDSVFRSYLEQSNKIGQKLLKKSLHSITKKIALENEQNIIVFNDLSWDRDGFTTVDISHLKGNDWIVVTSDGNEVPTQLITSNEKKELIFSSQDTPSIGYKTFRIKSGTSKKPEIKAGANYCENEFYSVEFGQGGITKLHDKHLKKDIFNTTKMVGGDMYHMGYKGQGAGEFIQITKPNYKDFETAHEKESSWKRIESGAIYSKFSSQYKMKGFSVDQIITVFHQKKQIDLEYNVPDWPGEQNRQIRVLFPLKMSEKAQISYDVPMGMVHVGKDELKISPRGWSWEGTYHQMPEDIHPREIQNFMTANGDGFGFTMSTNIVTADWIDPSREAVDYTVLNSVLLSSHKSCHWKGNWYHQKGGHNFKFSITTHEEGWKNAYHFGIENNHPLLTVLKEDKQKGKLPLEKSFVSTSDKFSRITTMKKAEDDNDVVLRVLEAEGVDKDIEINLDRKVKSVSKTDMIEENPQKLSIKGKTLKLKLGKNAVDTYKIK